MNKVLTITAILALGGACRLTADTNDARKMNDPAELGGRLRELALAKIAPIVSHIEDGSISDKESHSLRTLLDVPIRSDLKGKDAMQRQQIVMKFLGKADYERIRSYYLNQCRSASSPDARQMAADMLGHRLFSIESRDILISLALSEDRQTQFFAIISLACIGEKGACSLLHYVIMSQRFGDAGGAYALGALGVANDPAVRHLAVQLCLSPNSGPMMVFECLQLMKSEPEYYGIVCDMIKDNRFAPPHRKQEMTGEEIQRSRVLAEVLRVVDDNVARLIKDEALFRKIREYAESNDIDNMLCRRALMILKKAGEDSEYFQGLLRGPGVPEEKKVYLRKILALIEKESSAQMKDSKVNP